MFNQNCFHQNPNCGCMNNCSCSNHGCNNHSSDNAYAFAQAQPIVAQKKVCVSQKVTPVAQPVICPIECRTINRPMFYPVYYPQYEYTVCNESF